MKRPLFSTLLAVLFLNSLFAQINEPDFLTPPDTIPFTFTEFGNISIPVLINETDSLDLMFHTAQSAVALTSEALEHTSAINMDGSAEATTWGGKASMRFSQQNRMQIGVFSWDSIFITEDTYSGKMTDGKFGPDLFEGKILEINYDRNALVIHSELPKMADDFQKVNLEIDDRGMMYVQGVLEINGEKHKNNYLIHSGFAGTLLLDGEFAEKTDISNQLETISESELKDSFGNVLKTKKVLAPAFSIGAIKFPEVPVGLFEGALAQQKISVLGGDLLKRFNLIIDQTQGDIYLQPNTLFGMAYYE